MSLSVKIVTSEPDRKYRTLVVLQREDRPKYWTFHCVNCKTIVAELGNVNVHTMTDFYNPQSAENTLVGVRCQGAYCRRYYYFQLK